jgi:hypothetical protein
MPNSFIGIAAETLSSHNAYGPILKGGRTFKGQDKEREPYVFAGAIHVTLRDVKTYVAVFPSSPVIFSFSSAAAALSPGEGAFDVDEDDGVVVLGRVDNDEREDDVVGAGLYRCCHLCGVVKTPPCFISAFDLRRNTGRNSLPSPAA